MEIKLNNEQIILQKKQRKLGSEAPALRVKMLDMQTKVIGMMADKVQVLISLPYQDSMSDKLLSVIEKHKKKALIYTISSEPLNKNVEDAFSSLDFKDYSLKMGVYINNEVCAKSIFIINKDGEIVYKEVLPTLDEEFDLELFDKSLDEAIKFKKKGHTHENWMGV